MAKEKTALLIGGPYDGTHGQIWDDGNVEFPIGPSGLEIDIYRRAKQEMPDGTVKLIWDPRASAALQRHRFGRAAELSQTDNSALQRGVEKEEDNRPRVRVQVKKDEDRRVWCLIVDGKVEITAQELPKTAEDGTPLFKEEDRAAAWIRSLKIAR